MKANVNPKYYAIYEELLICFHTYSREKFYSDHKKTFEEGWLDSYMNWIAMSDEEAKTEIVKCWDNEYAEEFLYALEYTEQEFINCFDDVLTQIKENGIVQTTMFEGKVNV